MHEDSIFGHEAPSRISVYLWCGEFNRGRSSIKDEIGEDCSKSVIFPKTIDAVRKLILQNEHMT